MRLSARLNQIAVNIPECECLSDIGTDHGFIPVYSVMNNISKHAIASDIKKGPIKIAEKNILKYGLAGKIETRIGPGLSVLDKYESDIIVIAGMGGVLISDIISSSIEIAKSAQCLILQPVQYPEVLRKYLLDSGFTIIDEDIAKEDGKYYHIIKAQTGCSCGFDREVLYYTGTKLIEKKHPLIREYIEYKITNLSEILNGIPSSTQDKRRQEIIKLINEFEDVLKCI